MKAAYAYLEKEKQLKQANRLLGENYIKVFPVPFSNQFSVLYKSASAGTFSMELIDVTGRLLSSQSRTVSANEIYFIEMKQLDRLPAGQYFLRYRDGSRNGTLTLVK